MNLRPEEISTLIKDQIKNYRTKIEPAETGTVILFGDGIAKAHGLRSCVSNELLEFDDGSIGIAQNLEEEVVSIAVLSDCFSCFVSDFFYYQYGICRMYSKENPQYFRLPVSGLYP